jgi:outer membrane protein assembly factor BamB
MVFLIISIFVKNLDTPESAFFDGEFVYVSCINGLPSEKDGNGYIAKIKKTGEIVNKEFIKGLNAPKGVWVKDKYIFVADIDMVCVYDKDGNNIDRIKVPDAKFLNDLFVLDSLIFITDTKNDCVYKVLFKDRKLKFVGMKKVSGGPNGIFLENGNIYIATWNSGEIIMLDMNLDNKKVILSGLEELDGIWVENGIITFSSWDGNIYQILNNKKIVLVKNLVSPADFCFKDLIIFIPEFTENRLRIEKLE